MCRDRIVVKHLGISRACGGGGLAWKADGRHNGGTSQSTHIARIVNRHPGLRIEPSTGEPPGSPLVRPNRKSKMAILPTSPTQERNCGLPRHCEKRSCGHRGGGKVAGL